MGNNDLSERKARLLLLSIDRPFGAKKLKTPSLQESCGLF